MARDTYSSGSAGMSTTTKCQHGLVFSTLALLILIVALVVFLSPITRRSGAYVTPVTRINNVTVTTPYSIDATTVLVVVQDAAIPVDTVVVTNTNADNTGVRTTSTGTTATGSTAVQYVRGSDGVVYAVPTATATAVVDGTSRDNYRGRGKRDADRSRNRDADRMRNRDADRMRNRGSGSIVVTVYPVSAYGSGYMVSGNVSSLVPAETYVLTFHQFGDMSGGCSQLGQGMRLRNIPVGGVNTEATGDNYIRHALVDSNGTIIGVANPNGNTNTGSTSGATAYVIENAVPVAVSNYQADYTNYAPSNYGYGNYGRGGNTAVLQPVSNGSNYVVVNQDGTNQTYYSGARAFGQGYNQNGLPSNVAFFIPGVDYSGNDTSYYRNDPNGVYNKLNPVSVRGTGNNDHVVYQNNTQNDESNVKFLPLQTVVNATTNTNYYNGGYVPVNYVPVSGYPTDNVVVVNPRSNVTTGYTQYLGDNYVPRERDGRRGRNKRQTGPLSAAASRRDARDYNGAVIGTFVTDENGRGNFDFYIPEESACGNPRYLYGRTVAIRPVYGVRRNKRQIVAGQPVDGVYGLDISGSDGSGTTYQTVNNTSTAAVQGVTIIRPDRLMPVDANYAGRMRDEGMRRRFQRMSKRPTMAPGMRMGQPISCGILGRA
ncbi:hypothetical protein RvY_04937 [Ramazzottius varieornatus]|uniref:Uncharacterized protein n=1 Tax=Ramazzottius varieornatus TaxID=947166 RepID=A0A1D1UZ24_RAMVA|nr:hypothetical protein RvY_04937 [Ramazzottius varieornatus]